MRKWIIAICIAFSCHLYSSTTLKERFTKAHEGDFVVTSQANHYSLLLIRTLTPTQLVLEEITIPSHALDPAKTRWREWIDKQAPGHTSWISYTFDLEKNSLAKAYSLTQKQWLFVDKSDYLLAELLTLPLHATPDAERKRIGPTPLSGEADRRKLWLPALIRAGKKASSAHFEIVKTKWPDDQSKLAGCDVELYLDADSSFPFPYWLEVQGAHYTFKMQAVDSGNLR